MESSKVDDCISCPYNSEHKVIPDKLVMHLINCESKDSAEDTKVRCPFDATIILPIEEIIEHLKNDCTSKPSEQIIERLQQGVEDWVKLIQVKTNGKQQETKDNKKLQNDRHTKKNFTKLEDSKTDNRQSESNEETRGNGYNKPNQFMQSSRTKSVKTYRKVADTDVAKLNNEKQAVSQDRPFNIVSEALPDMG